LLTGVEDPQPGGASNSPIGKRHSQDFVVGVRLATFDASVGVPLLRRLRSAGV